MKTTRLIFAVPFFLCAGLFLFIATVSEGIAEALYDEDDDTP